MLKADNLTTILCQLSINLGTLTSWNPLGTGDRGGTVVKVLCYKLEGSLFDS